MHFPESSPLILIGMHRSGTSLLARLLGRLGVHMGDELDIHHEAWFFKRANNALLAMANAHWANPAPFLLALQDPSFRHRCRQRAEASISAGIKSYGDANGAPAWGWKDPRTTLTLPIWLDVFPHARILYLEREKIDVALSLHRRELRRWTRPSEERRLLPPTLGACLRLYEQYCHQGQTHAAQQRALSLCYEDLLRAPLETLGRLRDSCDLPASDQDLEALLPEIHQPTPRSRVETLRLRILSRLGILSQTTEPSA